MFQILVPLLVPCSTGRVRNIRQTKFQNNLVVGSNRTLANNAKEGLKCEKAVMSAQNIAECPKRWAHKLRWRRLIRSVLIEEELIRNSEKYNNWRLPELYPWTLQELCFKIPNQNYARTAFWDHKSCVGETHPELYPQCSIGGVKGPQQCRRRTRQHCVHCGSKRTVLKRPI